MWRRVLLVAAAAMFGLAAYSYWMEHRDPWALSLVQAENDLGKVELEKETSVSWTIVNRSGQDWRLVGIVDEPC